MKKFCLGLLCLLLIGGWVLSSSGSGWVSASTQAAVSPYLHTKRHLITSTIRVTEERQAKYADLLLRLKARRDILAAEGKSVSDLDVRLRNTESTMAESQLLISQIIMRLETEYDSELRDLRTLRSSVHELQVLFSSLHNSLSAALSEAAHISK